MQQIDWLEYYTEHGEDPKFEVFGSDWEEILRDDDFENCVYESIQRVISEGLPGDPIPESVCVVAGNTLFDADGIPVPFEHGPDGTFELTDNTEIRVDVREWCRINDAMGLLEVDDATK